MTLIPLLEAAGLLLILLAVLHGFFPRRFRWKQHLAGADLLTRQIFYVHTFFIALVIALMGLLCLFHAADLGQPGLGRAVAGGMAVFWGCRLLIQFFGYSPALWRGKRFETAMHILFSLLWFFLTALFAATAWLPPQS